MNPTLIAQPYAHWIANILTRFEDGKPLSSDQLNFLMSHETTLHSHALDLVIKYYLGSHQHTPDKALSFTLPKDKIDFLNVHNIKDVVVNMLQHHLSHVDLKMTVQQFLQLKATGFRDIVFWHGPQFLSRTSQFNNVNPLVMYFQWGKLFGVVKMNAHIDQLELDGNVLIYFEDMDMRSLNQCILDYAEVNNHHLILDLQNNEELFLKNQPVIEPIHITPTPRLTIYQVNAKEQTTSSH